MSDALESDVLETTQGKEKTFSLRKRTYLNPYKVKDAACKDNGPYRCGSAMISPLPPVPAV